MMATDEDLLLALALARLSKADTPVVHPHLKLESHTYSLTGEGIGVTYNLRHEYGEVFVEIPVMLFDQPERKDRRKAFHDEDGKLSPLVLTEEYGWYVLIITPEQWGNAIFWEWTPEVIHERYGLSEEYAKHCRTKYGLGIRSHSVWEESFIRQPRTLTPQKNVYEIAREARSVY